MSENEKNELNEGAEEFSSVFSDPAEHKRIEVKAKKLWPKIVASVLAVVILIGGTVAVIKLIPKMEDDNNSSVGIEEISVKSLTSDDISSVTVNNSIGATEFYSESVEEDDTTTVNWYVKGIDKELTNSSTISGVVSQAAKISSTRKITEKTAEECGLKNPKIWVEVTPTKGDKYKISFGDKSPDNSGYYLMLDEKDIYLVNDSVYTSFQFELTDFAVSEAITGVVNEDGALDSYYTSEQLASFDRLTLKGDKHPETVEFVPNTEELTKQYLPFMITAPSKRIADSQIVQPILTLYQSGVSVSGAYSYDVSSASIKKYGLDKPTLETKIYLGKTTATYKFALQEDGNYAAIGDNSHLIHKVAAATLEGIIDLSTTDYYSGWLFFTSIDEVTNFTVKTEEKSYSFDISKIEDEDEEESYKVIANGKEIVGSNFQNLYQYLISVMCSDFTVDKLNTQPKVVWEITLKSNYKMVLEFTEYSATKYQCTNDGIVMGKVPKSSVDKAIKYAEKCAKGEKIGDIVT